MSSSNQLNAILADEKLRRELFPVTQSRTYLAHAAVSPLPTCVAAAVSSYAEQASRLGQFEYLHREAERQTRKLAAELIGASAEEIAFIPSTSAGLSMVAAGLSWRRGDIVLISESDFPANTYPWLNLRRLGVSVKFIPRTDSGLVTVEDVESHLDPRTRLVSLSTVHFSSGMPIQVNTIGKFLRERGILFCVDAIQSLGILPCIVKHVDFLAADAHKWLLGPQGIGILFVRRENFEKLHPMLVGWKTPYSPLGPAPKVFGLADSARRYEPGSLNAVGIVGLSSALSLISDIGVSAISQRLAALRSRLIHGLQAKDYEVLGSSARNLQTGITSFGHRGKDLPILFKELDKKGIVLSLRDDPDGNKCIRISPHFYNTEDEIDFLLNSI